MTKQILSILTVIALLCTMMVPIASAEEQMVYVDGTDRPISSIRTSGDYQYYVREDGTIALSKYLGYEKKWRQKIKVPEQIEGRAVTRIGMQCFRPPIAVVYEDFIRYAAVELETVVLPKTIKEIGSGAFADCTKLRTINFPASLEVIGSSAFSWTNLEELTIPGTVKTIDSWAFEYSDVKTVTLKDGVQVLGDFAFWGCTRLKKIVVEGKTKIGHQAFSNCPNLKTYRFSKDVRFGNRDSIHKTQIGHAVNEYNEKIYSGIKVYGYKGSPAADVVEVINDFWSSKIKFIPLTSLKKTKVKGVKAVKYTKAVKKNGAKQSVKVYVKGKKLKKGTDYTVSYRNNKKRGKATVIITGINKYDGVIKRTFNIK